MRIETDLRANIPGRQANGVSFQSSQRRAEIAVHNQISASNTQPMSLNNAMVMMQKAQDIVQQALSVSGRMRNIAAESMATGRVDSNSVAVELSGLDRSISQYGGNLAPPPVQEQPAYQYDMQVVQSGISEMRDMSASGRIQTETLDTIDIMLNDQQNRIQRQLDGLTERVLGSNDVFSGGIDQAVFSALTGNIVSNPDNSVAMQGDLSAATVSYLTSA